MDVTYGSWKFPNGGTAIRATRVRGSLVKAALVTLRSVPFHPSPSSLILGVTEAGEEGEGRTEGGTASPAVSLSFPLFVPGGPIGGLCADGGGGSGGCGGELGLLLAASRLMQDFVRYGE